MIYQELKDRIKILNVGYGTQLKVSHDKYSVFISDSDTCYVVVSNQLQYSLSMPDIVSNNLEDNLRHDLLNIVHEFAQTPIKSRCIVHKFYISSKLTPKVDEKFLFKFGGSVDHLAWGFKDGGDTEFTQDEIDYIKKKFHTDLSDFNIDEVTE